MKSVPLNEWIWAKERRVRLVVAAVVAFLNGLLVFLRSDLGKVVWEWLAHNWRLASFLMQAAVILILIYRMRRAKCPRDQENETAGRSVREFRNKWEWFWYALLLLYALMALQVSVTPESAGRALIPVALNEDLAGKDLAVAGALLGVPTSVATVPNSERAGKAPEGVVASLKEDDVLAADLKPGASLPLPLGRCIEYPVKDPTKIEAGAHVPWFAAAVHWLTFLIATTANLLLFLCYVVLNQPTVDRSEETPSPWAPWVMLTIALVCVQVAGEVIWPSWQVAAEIVNAAAGAVALALLAGRLESKIIGLPTWSIGVLYGYAAIQMIQPMFAFPGGDALKAVCASIALPLKLFLFGVVQWAIESGRLLYYMRTIRRFDERQEFERDDYLNHLPG